MPLASDVEGCPEHRPHKEHHRDTTKKQRHAGFRAEDRITHSHSDHGHGHTVSEAQVPIYEDVTEERVHYMALNDQQLMTEVAVEQQQVGHCRITDGEKVYDHRFADFEDPGVFEGYSEGKLAQHIDWLKRHALLRTPVEIEHEHPSCEQPKSKPSQPKNGKAPTKKARNGMA